MPQRPRQNQITHVLRAGYELLGSVGSGKRGISRTILGINIEHQAAALQVAGRRFYCIQRDTNTGFLSFKLIIALSFSYFCLYSPVSILDHKELL